MTIKMAVRQDQVQLHIDFITDESRALARTLLTTKEYNKEIYASTAKIKNYQAELQKTNISEARRVELLGKIAVEEKNVATNLAKVVAEGKKVKNLDLTKLAPAQLTERAKQLQQALRLIPQSAPEFARLSTELARVNGQLGLIKNQAKGLQDAAPPAGGGFLQRVLGVAGGLGVFELAKSALRSLVNFGQQALDEVDAQLKADAQIKEAIRSTGGVAGKSLQDLKTQAEALQKVTLFSDDQTEGAQALLLTFKNIRGEIFDQTGPLVQDLSTALKQDLSSSAIQVGKALEDPVKGVTALRRAGITFSQDQQAMIKTLVETGRTADAQRIILKELESQVGGSARAAADAGKGPLQILKNVFGEMKEAVGGIVLTIVRDFVPGIRSMVSAITDFLSQPVSEKLEEERQSFNGVSLSILNAEVGTKARTEAIKKLQQQYPQFLGSLDAEKATNEQLKPILDKINQSYIIRIALQKQQEKIQPLLEAQAEQENKLAEGREAYNRQLVRGAEISGVNLQAFKTEAEQTQAVVAALRKTAQFREGLGFSQPLNEQARILSQIQATSSQIDASGIRQKRAAEEVTAAEQIRQGVVAELRKSYGDLVDVAQGFSGKEGAVGGTGKGDKGEGDGAAGKAKKESEAAAGSIAFLRKQISDLQKEIENTPGDSKALQPLIEQLKEAEKRLKELEAFLERLKGPQGDIAPTQDQVTSQLGPGLLIDTSLDEEQRAAIVDLNAFRINEEQLTIDEINKLREGLSDEDKRRREKELAAEEQREKDIRELKFSAAESIANALAQIEGNRIQRETEEATSALDKEYAAKIKAAEGNSAVQARLQQELEKKKAAIELDAAKKRKALAIKEAIIAGALAVLKALPNVFAAVAAGVAAAAQIAIISSQKFARGGYTGPGYGQRDETGFKPAGIVHEGEYVVPKRIVQSAQAAPVLNWLESHRLRGYADGGLVTVNTTPNSNSFAPTQQQPALTGVDGFMAAVERFTATVQAFPREVKSRVVLTELETAQGRLDAVREDAAI